MNLAKDTYKEVILSITFTLYGKWCRTRERYNDITKTIFIVDDETPKLEISPSPYIISENANSFNLGFNLEEQLTSAITFDLEIGLDGDSAVYGYSTNDGDYVNGPIPSRNLGISETQGF